MGDYFNWGSSKKGSSKSFGSKAKGKNTEDDEEDWQPYGATGKKKSYGSYYGGYYGDYSGGYGGSYGKSYGGGNYGGWNWGTYGSSTLKEEEDDKDLYIKSHESYFTPTSDLIGDKLHFQQNTASNRAIIKEYARFFYHRMIEQKDYLPEKYKDLNTLKEAEKEKVMQKTKYYEELWDKFVPGITPLEQALALFEELQRQNQQRKGATTEELEEVDRLDRVEFHEEIYKDPVFNELLEMQPLAKKHKMDILNKISMIKNLGSQFKIEKEITEKIVANSQLISKKIMRDYGQLHQVDLYQRLMPTFKSKLLTKSLVVNTPIDKTEHKQKIIMLLDYSGSMSVDEKQKWVLAILIDRLKYVMKEEAEIFFSYFVNEVSDLNFHHVFDRDSALKFWSTFSTRPNGGDTRLGDMINHINNEIKNRRKLHNLNVDLSEETPEILAINDGQDSVKTTGFTYKTNAITLVDSENPELKKLCIENDGKYVYISTKGTVKTYDKSTLK